MNPRYVPSLVAALGLRQSVGVLGGRPGSSLYFVGAQDERLFYLDPHTVQPALEVSDGRSDGGLGGAASPRELKKKPRRVFDGSGACLFLKRWAWKREAKSDEERFELPYEHEMSVR